MKTTRTSNWSNFREDRAKRMRFKVEESIDGADFTAVDLSASTAKVYFRVWREPVGSQTTSDFVLNALQSKVGDGSGGQFDTTNTITASYGEVMCALVLVDEAVTSQPTPSTYQEEDLKVWKAKVSPSVQPS